MNSTWTFTTSCYPYSDDLLVWDGRNTYACSIGCERCGCEMARVDPDGETDSEGHTRNLTTYWCADCGAKLERDEVMDTCGHDTLTGALARSMFRNTQPKEQLMSNEPKTTDALLEISDRALDAMQGAQLTRAELEHYRDTLKSSYLQATDCLVPADQEGAKRNLLESWNRCIDALETAIAVLR